MGDADLDETGEGMGVWMNKEELPRSEIDSRTW